MQTGIDSVHHQPTGSSDSLGISVEVKTDLEIIIICLIHIAPLKSSSFQRKSSADRKLLCVVFFDVQKMQTRKQKK